MSAEPLDEPTVRAEHRRVIERILPQIRRTVDDLCRGAPAELRAEAMQEACTRAALAASRFDRERFDARFASYAAPYVAGAVHDVLWADGQRRRAAEVLVSAAREALAETTDHFEVIWDPPSVNREKLLLAARHAIAARWVCAATSESAEEVLLSREARQHARGLLSEALGRLGEDERAVYEGHYVRGCTFVALAEELGVDPRTVRRRHAALLDRVGRVLRREGVDENPGTLGP